MKINLNHIKTNDEWVTPPEAVKPLIREFKNLKETKIIDPFGSPTSEFNAFKELLNAEISFSDFFTMSGEDFLGKIIVSNPPFSIKNHVLDQCVHLYEKNCIQGFALLLPIQSLQGCNRGFIFKHLENTLRVRIFSSRIKFFHPDGKTQTKSCMFGSLWIAYGAVFTKGPALSWY